MQRKLENVKVDMYDCRMVCHEQGSTCYIMDTYCRDITKEQRADIERCVLRIYRQASIQRANDKNFLLGPEK